MNADGRQKTYATAAACFVTRDRLPCVGEATRQDQRSVKINVSRFVDATPSETVEEPLC